MASSSTKNPNGNQSSDGVGHMFENMGLTDKEKTRWWWMMMWRRGRVTTPLDDEGEKDDHREPGWDDTEERASGPLGQFGHRVRTQSGAGPKGEAPGRDVSIRNSLIQLYF